MKTITIAFLIPLLLIFWSPVLLHAQGGDDPAPPHASAQHVRFEHLTTEQGLSSDIVWGIVQDDHGFIWIGTVDGLNRYDGNTFKIYRYDPNDPNSLGNNSVHALAKDRAGNIWIGSSGGGLTMLDPSTEQFTRYGHDPGDPHSLSGSRVLDIHEDQAGMLWVATTAGLNRLDRETGTFTRYRHDPDEPDGLGDDAIEAVYGDQTGDLWIGTDMGGLHRLDPDTGKFTHYRHDPADPNSLSSDRITSVYQDPSGIVWIGTFDRGLNRLDPHSGLFTSYQYDPGDPNSLGNNSVWTITQDREGVLWVGTFGGGLFQFDRDTGKFISYQHDASDPNSLSHDGVVALYREPGGALWIATNGGGVNRLDPNRKPFALYRHSPTDPGSLSNNDVRSIYVDHTDTLWIGTALGLNRYSRPVDGPVDPQAEPGSASGQFARYLHDRTDPQGLNGVYVMSMVEDQNGALWIGSLEKGLIRFDRDRKGGIDTGRFTQYQHDPSDPHSLQPDLVRDLYEDSSGTLWVGTLGGGLAWFDRETEEFHRYQHDPGDPKSLSSNQVVSILEDDSGELWLATVNGINRFVRETEEFVRYTHDPNDPDSLSNDVARELFKDREGVLWIGTNGGGLNRFVNQDERFTRYTEQDGLPSDMIAGITQDDEGFLWIGTSQGLSKFDPRSETFRNYDASDGLQANQFNINSLARNSSGELFFGGVAGFNAFHPADIKDSPAIPPVVIADFQLANRPVEIGGDSVLQKSIIETKELVLSHDDRVISFEFAALNYSSPEKNRYRYRLEGFDEEWTEVGSDRRFATYTNLDPGAYTFRVLGSNNDGVWNEEGAAINITVTPPWWQTWWSRGGVILLLVGLVVGGFVWQRESARRRERQLEAVVAERTHDLDERVKELDCLYGISRLAGQQGFTLEQIMGEVVDLLPPAMESPELACARIVFDKQEVKTDNFQETPWQQSSAIVVRGEQAGQVEVAYLEERPEADEGPLSEEERILLSAVAERLGRIAERKQSETALQASEEKYRDLVEEISDVIYSVDAGGVITYLNPAGEALIGLPAEQVVGQPFAQFIHSEDLGRLQENVQNLTSGEAPGSEEYRVLNVLGETRWIRVTSQPIMDGDRFTGLQGVLTDITERKRIEAQLEAEAMAAERQRLARDLHDSVTQTLFSASVIAEATPLIWQKDPEIGQRNLEQLHRLTRGALAEMRTLLLELRPAALQDQKLRELLETLAEAAQTRIRAPVVVKAEGDCVMPDDVTVAFYRVAQEALNNVAKHAEATQVHVSLVCEPCKLVMRIRDDGRGFDPGATPQGRLGIAIMEERAMEIGADLLIDSEPGSGTEILVAWADSSKKDRHD